jgi:MFS family permease
MIAMIRARNKPAEQSEMSLDYLLGGFRFVFKNPLILSAITLDLFAVLFGGATALLPVFAEDILKVGASGLGLLQSALPVGSLLCALVMAHRPPIRKAGRALFIAVLVFGIATMGFGLSKSFPLSLFMLFICGCADYVSVIVRHTLVQLHTPDEMRGRVSAVNGLFIGTSNELGGFESGSVAHRFGSVFSVVSGGFATILVVLLVFWRWPELRRYGKLGGQG